MHNSTWQPYKSLGSECVCRNLATKTKFAAVCQRHLTFVLAGSSPNVLPSVSTPSHTHTDIEIRRIQGYTGILRHRTRTPALGQNKCVMRALKCSLIWNVKLC